jgi:hypothetical protein
MTSSNETITTVNGKQFTHGDHVQLAKLVYERFGCDLQDACNAWQRLLQNNCSLRQFRDLIEL